jgi:VIT1/CCC1 family predicted Fe2+/Mn2+ transporter
MFSNLSLQQKRRLIQGEYADLELYKSLKAKAKGEFANTLSTFIQTETRHVAFWEQTFKLHLTGPSWLGRLRNLGIRVSVAVFGQAAGYLLLEAVESHGIRQYLDLWKNLTDDTEAKAAIRQILTEELEHEDEVATGGERQVNPELVRNAFLGFNDGSVEILGAVSGLAAALSEPYLVAIAAGTVSVAGAVSMAAGGFLSSHAENELQLLAAAKAEFLNGQKSEQEKLSSPWKAATIVGVGYLIGAAVPVAPFFFGTQNPWWSIGLSGTLILLVSAALSFLSGMNLKRRMVLNAVIITLAVLISYLIGHWLDSWIG